MTQDILGDENTNQENQMEELIDQESESNQDDDKLVINVSDFDDMDEDEKKKALYKARKIAAERGNSIKELKQQLTAPSDQPEEETAEKADESLQEGLQGLPTGDVFVITSHQLSDVEYEKAKSVASIEKMSLKEAVNSDFFKFWRKEEAEKKKKEEAAMRASKGSGMQKKSKDFSTPGLTSEERKKLWKKKLSG